MYITLHYIPDYIYTHMYIQCVCVWWRPIRISSLAAGEVGEGQFSVSWGWPVLRCFGGCWMENGWLSIYYPYMIHKCILGWWLNWLNWLNSYIFSRWLKPPTRLMILLSEFESEWQIFYETGLLQSEKYSDQPIRTRNNSCRSRITIQLGPWRAGARQCHQLTLISSGKRAMHFSSNGHQCMFCGPFTRLDDLPRPQSTKREQLRTH